MSYGTLIDSYSYEAQSLRIAQDILANMKALRQESNPADNRRWIWELLQNGKDVSLDDIDFKAIVNFKDEQDSGLLEFRHNGRPFSIKNVTYLVEQVSSKDQEPDENGHRKETGKFGTGFITTHLLSEIVDVEAIVKDPELPFKKCQFSLDRSATNAKGIQESILQAKLLLKALDSLPDHTSYNPSAANTSFRYKLDISGLEIAKLGLQELDRSLPYTLVFVPIIKQVEVASDGIIYKLEHKDSVPGEKVNKRKVLKIHKDVVVREDEFLVSGTSRVQVMIPVKSEGDNLVLQPIPEKVPKVFCDFPVIGMEEFPFPAVINSHLFKLNNPRSEVRLTDVEEEDIILNRSLILEAVDCFIDLLEFCADQDVKHLYHLANFSSDPGVSYISKTWFNEKVSKVMHEALSIAPIVDTNDPENRKKAIVNENGGVLVNFPVGKNDDVRTRIYNLISDLYPTTLPILPDIHEWSRVVWGKCNKVNIKGIGNFIQERKTIPALQLKDGKNIIEWLNSFYDLVNVESSYIEEIVANHSAVLPNQNGDFRHMKDLFDGSAIPDTVKDILLILGIDIRKELRHSDIITYNVHEPNPKNLISHKVRELSSVFLLILERMQNSEEVKRLLAAKSILSLRPNQGEESVNRIVLREIFEAVNDEKIMTTEIFSLNAALFEYAEKIVLEDVMSSVNSSGCIKELSKSLSLDALKTNEFLIKLINLVLSTDNEELLNKSRFAVLPDQNGDFRLKEQLSRGDETDEELKDILVLLNNDFRTKLIDKEIPLKFQNAAINDSDLAAIISPSIIKSIVDGQDNKVLFQKMFNWLNKNSKAEELFPELYANRSRLYPLDEIEKNREKAEAYDKILESFDFDDIEALADYLIKAKDSEDKIKNSKQDTDDAPITIVTAEILASLGITELAQYQEALKDKNLAELFRHAPEPTFESLQIVRALIEESRVKIKNFLISIGYTFTEEDPVAPTVYGGVLTPKGESIDIVFRPAHNNQVIFYYGSEKQTLESPGSELWVYKGFGNPVNVTLGRILRINKINKVRID